MNKLLRALLIEDSEIDAMLIVRELQKGNFTLEYERIDTVEAMASALLRVSWDIILSDYVMPTFSALNAYALLKKSGNDIPFIIISGTIGEETAVEAIRTGINDYLMKGHLRRLVPAVERAIKETNERRRRRETEEALRVSEARLRQAQKMEAVGRLAGGVAHDFNNLLTAISGYAELALHDMKGTDPLAQDITEIKKCAFRAASLTRQLLAFSRKQILVPTVMNFNLVVAEMNKMAKRLIGEDIQLVTTLDPNLKKVRADSGQMEQVILNLLVNARDAMPEGGTLTLETANVELSAAHVLPFPGLKPGSYVKLAVKDTGCGMDEETQQRLFEPFFTTKGEGKGTGLGLATVYGIIKQSEGHVYAESQVGQGTTFLVYLPPVADEYEVQAAPVPELLQSLEGTETILLVEDEDVVRELARRVLVNYGYQVLDAANAGEALLICEQHTGAIDLILTDIVMPKMSGSDLVQRLEALHPEMSVLFMSGYTDPGVLKEVMNQMRPFILKPFLPEGLARKVREVLKMKKGKNGAVKAK